MVAQLPIVGNAPAMTSRTSLLLVGADPADTVVVDRLRVVVDLVVVASVDEAIDAMLRVRPGVVILHGALGAAKPTDLARSLRSLVTEDVIVLHVGPVAGAPGARAGIDAELGRPLRAAEVLEVLDRIHRDGGTELKITTRMPRLR